MPSGTAEAESHLARARDLAAELFGRDDPRYFISISNLGDLLVDLGRYREAETLLLEFLELRRRLLGPQHYRLGEGHAGLARLRLSEDRPAEALKQADTRASASIERRDTSIQAGSSSCCARVRRR